MYRHERSGFRQLKVALLGFCVPLLIIAPGAAHASPIVGPVIYEFVVAPDDSLLLVSSQLGPFRSEDGGLTWRAEPISWLSWKEHTPGVMVAERSGPVPGLRRLAVPAPGRKATFQDTHYACIERKLLLSINNGETWSQKGQLPVSDDICLAIAASERVLYLGTGQGLYEAPRDRIGAVALTANPILRSAGITALLAGKGGEVFVNAIMPVDGKHVLASFVRLSSATDWRQVQFPESDRSTSSGYRIVGLIDGELFASSGKGVVGSGDGGQTWTAAQAGIEPVQSLNMIVIQGDGNGNLYATARETLWKRIKGQSHWTALRLTAAGFAK